MTVVTFREDLYSGFSIDEAAKAYVRFATFELKQGDGLYRVEISGNGRFDEERLALEFQNFALGATIERLKRGMADAPAKVSEGDPGARTAVEGERK